MQYKDVIQVNQGTLEKVVRSLFKENIIRNARKQAQVISPISQTPLEVDVYIPLLNLCLEFQDGYHYRTTFDSHVPLDHVQLRDDSIIRKRGETLIDIPWWWDGRAESLVAEIKFHRPDLLQFHSNYFSPIPLNSFELKDNFIPGVGELMLPSFSVDPVPSLFKDSDSFWWVGEKYDGIRACWNPTKNLFYTRSGYKIDLYPITNSLLGNTFLDSEIWFGRGNFEESQLLVNSNQQLDFSALRIVAFDNPNHCVHNLPFEKRYEILLDNISIHHPTIKIASRIKSNDYRRLLSLTSAVMDNNGEGVIMRKSSSLYTPGRSMELIKFKTTRADQEALVVSVHGADAYGLQMPSGIVFDIGSDNIATNQIIQQGDIVSFTFESISPKGVPTKPFVTRVRKDTSWKNIIIDYQLSLENEAYSSKRGGTKEKLRALFDQFAKLLNFDPLFPQNWYHCSFKGLNDIKEAKSLLRLYNDNFVDALVAAYPELILNKSKFSVLPRNYWTHKNRRLFFENFAKENKFDPLVAENWYNVTVEEKQRNEKMSSVLVLYQGSIIQAIDHLFPEIGFDKSRMKTFESKYHWTSKQNRRQYFEKYAKEKGFDPLVPQNWYNANLVEISKLKKAHAVSVYYNKSIARALVDLFPEIGLHLTKFTVSPKKTWHDILNRKQFYMELATKEGLTSPEQWMNISFKKINSLKGGSSILSYYRRDRTTMLADVKNIFPNIGIKVNDKTQ